MEVDWFAFCLSKTTCFLGFFPPSFVTSCDHMYRERRKQNFWRDRRSAEPLIRLGSTKQVKIWRVIFILRLRSWEVQRKKWAVTRKKWYALISQEMDFEVHEDHSRMKLQLPGALREKNGWGSSSHRSRGGGSWRTMVVGWCWMLVCQRWHLRDYMNNMKGFCLHFGWLEILDTNQPRTYTLYVHGTLYHISYIYLMYSYVTIFRSMHLQIEELVNLGDFGMNCMSSEKASLKCRSLWASWKGYCIPWCQTVTK